MDQGGMPRGNATLIFISTKEKQLTIPDHVDPDRG